MTPTFERELADIWLKQMRAITDIAELEAWAKERAGKFKLCAHLDEIREAYQVRMKELRGEQTT